MIYVTTMSELVKVSIICTDDTQEIEKS